MKWAVEQENKEHRQTDNKKQKGNIENQRTYPKERRTQQKMNKTIHEKIEHSELLAKETSTTCNQKIRHHGINQINKEHKERIKPGKEMLDSNYSKTRR